MMEFTARPTSVATALPMATFKHSAKQTECESTLLDPHVRESLYEKLPSRGRPLSYAEILRHWTQSVIKKQYAVHTAEEAQEEYEDYASDIIAITRVGQAWHKPRRSHVGDEDGLFLLMLC
ncbi:hypothetical protein HD554DRAFT_2041437 [Boletus coccyginus]|nr:hypothetical protein HD554DRAFT_2041437 [Boletus coccyginus]